MMLPLLLRQCMLAGVFALATASALAGATLDAPPPALVARLGLSASYTKYLDVDGLPVLGSSKVSDYALHEAAYIIRHMTAHRPELLRTVAGNKIRVAVMASVELTLDVPEHSDLTPAAYWNRRARGLGATVWRPAVSAGEENLLDLPGDPYASESILVHEFAHTIHELGMSSLDPTFDGRLNAAYQNAKAKGRWPNTYAISNHKEYWASAAQAWFDCARPADSDHIGVNTRAALRTYDPEVSALLAEVFGDTPWRYVRASRRQATELTHLSGFERGRTPPFAWPPQLLP